MPRHRTPPTHAAPTKILRNTLLLTSVAAAVTGVTVSGGVLSGGLGTASAGASINETALDPEALAALAPSAAEIASREDSEASRSDRREALDPAKEIALSGQAGAAVTVTEDVTDDDPRLVARALLGEFGFSQDQFGCLDSLWTRESQWRTTADNPNSSAYGIPQALPGSKMSSAGADWATNAATQIRWGLGYIQDRYGSPCGAWGHSQSNGWY